MEPLKSASKIIGKHISSGDTIIYESTVYPGVTEEVCVPILELESSLVFNQDFSIGYSPERINPGDKEKILKTLQKLQVAAIKIVQNLSINYINLLLMKRILRPR